jgi:UTP--glucose-1-phosphate uridylyltransferase
VEDTLERAGRTELLKPLHEVVKKLCVVSIRQHVALGLGHAVLCAEPAIGRDPFAVLLGDEIMISAPGRPSGIAQLARIYEETKQSTVAVIEVADRDVSKYGIVKVSEKGPNLWSVHEVVEKPEIGQAPSRLALPGRYVFAGGIVELGLRHPQIGSAFEQYLRQRFGGT